MPDCSSTFAVFSGAGQRPIALYSLAISLRASVSTSLSTSRFSNPRVKFYGAQIHAVRRSDLSSASAPRPHTLTPRPRHVTATSVSAKFGSAPQISLTEITWVTHLRRILRCLLLLCHSSGLLLPIRPLSGGFAPSTRASILVYTYLG